MLTIRKFTTTTIKKMTLGANKDLIGHNHELLNMQLRMAMRHRINTAGKGTIIMATAQQSSEAILTMTAMMTVRCGSLLIQFFLSIQIEVLRARNEVRRCWHFLFKGASRCRKECLCALVVSRPCFWSEIFLRLKYIECIASGCFNTFVQ
jgi:hypothetical protein